MLCPKQHTKSSIRGRWGIHQHMGMPFLLEAWPDESLLFLWEGILKYVCLSSEQVSFNRAVQLSVSFSFSLVLSCSLCFPTHSLSSPTHTHTILRFRALLEGIARESLRLQQPSAAKSGRLKKDPPRGTLTPDATLVDDSRPTGGSVLAFTPCWWAITSDAWVLQMLTKGYVLEFQCRSPNRF